MGKRDIVKEKPRKKRRIGLKIFLVILIAIAVYAGYFAYKTNKNGGGMQGMLATIVGHNENTLKDLEPIYCLVLGECVSGDSRLTDTIIVAKYDPKTQMAAMLSIPRDTYTGTDISRASAYYKINNAYKTGNDIENAVAAVNRITGLDIKYYVLVKSTVLRDLVDAVGGVNFDVPIRMLYTDTSQDLYIDLQAGYQLLNGSQAEQVVRFRHNDERLNWTTYPSSYGIEDYGRMRTQRAFISATVKQICKPENILKVGEFIDIFTKNVKTNIPIEVIKDYVPYAVNFNTENIQSEQLPGASKKCGSDGVWMFIHSSSETKEVVDRLFINPVIEEETDENNTVNTTNTVD